MLPSFITFSAILIVFVLFSVGKYFLKNIVSYFVRIFKPVNDFLEGLLLHGPTRMS